MEPKAITLLDWCVIVLAVALGWSLPKLAFGNAAVFGSTGGSVFLCFSLPVALSILVRQIKYRRSTRAAEWYALLGSAFWLAAAMPNVDTTLHMLHQRMFGTQLDQWDQWRWGLALSITILSVLVLFTIFVLRNSTRPGMTAGGLLLIAAMMLWGPASVWGQHLPIPRVTPMTLPLKLGDEVMLEIGLVLRSTPVLSVFLVSGMLTYASPDQRGQWTWTCWASAGFAWLSGLFALVFLAFSVFALSGLERLAFLLVRPLWLAGLLAISLVCAHRLGGKLVLGGQPTVAPSSNSN